MKDCHGPLHRLPERLELVGLGPVQVRVLELKLSRADPDVVPLLLLGVERAEAVHDNRALDAWSTLHRIPSQATFWKRRWPWKTAAAESGGGRSVLDICPLLWKDGWPAGGDNFVGDTFEIQSERSGESLCYPAVHEDNDLHQRHSLDHRAHLRRDRRWVISQRESDGNSSSAAAEVR